jgi:hypothetical protein
MGADAPLVAVVIGSALFLVAFAAVLVLSARALRQGTAFEGEIKAPLLTFRLKVDAQARNVASTEVLLVPDSAGRISSTHQGHPASKE